jgi:hypothetical protein
MKLAVHHLAEDDGWQDIARVPQEYRKSPNGRRLDRGYVYELSCTDTGKKAFIVLHGIHKGDSPTGIRMDGHTRKKLDVKAGESYEFELLPTNRLGEIRWALSSGDAVHRLSSKLTLVSLALGLIGLVLGVIAICLSHH